MSQEVTAEALAPTLSLKSLLARHGACLSATEWAAGYSTPEEAWEACERPDWLLWALNELKLRDEKKDRAFACRCAFETPLHDGRTTRELLTDIRSVAAVEIALRYAQGAATADELSAAESAAWSASWSAAESAAESAAWSASWSAARSAESAAAWSAWSAARSAARSAESAAWSAWSAARSAESAESAARSAAWSAARSAAAKKQAAILREIYANPFAIKDRGSLEGKSAI
jgi:hypothetical protein